MFSIRHVISDNRYCKPFKFNISNMRASAVITIFTIRAEFFGSDSLSFKSG